MTPDRKHLAAPDLRAMARRTARSRPATERHLTGCRSCREEVALLQALTLASPPAKVGPCPTAEALIDLADLAQGAPALLKHLHGCFDCAAEVDVLRRSSKVVARLPGPPRGLAVAVSTIVRRLRALVSFEMPLRLELATRGGTATAAGADYRRGMAAYRAGRYADAAVALIQADHAGRGASDLPFYLGVCQLHGGAGDAAVEQLRLAVKTEPELGEYRWYLGQALLAAGRGKEAAAELKRAARLPGPYAERARALAATVAKTLKG